MKEKARHVSAPGKDKGKYNHIEVAGRVKGCYNDLIRIVCNCLKILSFISDTHRTCSCEGIRTCHIV